MRKITITSIKDGYQIKDENLEKENTYTEAKCMLFETLMQMLKDTIEHYESENIQTIIICKEPHIRLRLVSEGIYLSSDMI